jgi:phosphatidylglycerophosphatase A
LVGLGQNAWKIAAAFVLFRVYDVLKPPPIRQAQLFQGGVGIVLDDLLAALFACGSTHLIVWAVSRFSH